MASVFETMSARLQAIDFQIGGKAASHPDVRSLFQVSFRDLAPTPRLALLPRLCEEHLATALVAVRQAIESRQAYFDAGDKFATLTLSLEGDTKAVELLKSEASAMSLRRDISTTAVAAEANTFQAVKDQSGEMTKFVQSIHPSADGPSGDANRSKWLSYLGRSFDHGIENMVNFWGSSSQTDKRPSEDQVELVMSPTMKIVDSESELAKRAVFAAYRVAHDRATIEQISCETAVTAAQGRKDLVAATEKFDEAAATLAGARSDAADSLLKNKIEMTRDITLHDFKAQMDLHRSRAQDLFVEASERAMAALTGLRTVYDFVLPDLPAIALESAEDLLFWCRNVARILVGLEPRVAKQTVTISAREIAGANWQHDIAQGITLDAQSLHDLGFVVRLRNVNLRFMGSQRSGFPIKIRMPGIVADRDAEGAERKVIQPAGDIQLVATSATNQDMPGRASAARVVHNICPSGSWILQANGVGSAVDDLLLDMDVSYLVA
ncbi:MAG TPA: hypothetical protein VN999_08330 [Thermoanaerobaculia bacterium]|nr:hypothetical protein [Thermoanaerobaculia bacterium]